MWKRTSDNALSLRGSSTKTSAKKGKEREKRGVKEGEEWKEWVDEQEAIEEERTRSRSSVEKIN